MLAKKSRWHIPACYGIGTQVFSCPQRHYAQRSSKQCGPQRPRPAQVWGASQRSECTAGLWRIEVRMKGPSDLLRLKVRTKILQNSVQTKVPFSSFLFFPSSCLLVFSRCSLFFRPSPWLSPGQSKRKYIKRTKCNNWVVIQLPSRRISEPKPLCWQTGYTVLDGSHNAVTKTKNQTKQRKTQKPTRNNTQKHTNARSFFCHSTLGFC